MLIGVEQFDLACCTQSFGPFEQNDLLAIRWIGAGQMSARSAARKSPLLQAAPHTAFTQPLHSFQMQSHHLERPTATILAPQARTLVELLLQLGSLLVRRGKKRHAWRDAGALGVFAHTR